MLINDDLMIIGLRPIFVVTIIIKPKLLIELHFIHPFVTEGVLSLN